MAWLFYIVWPFVATFFKTIFRSWKIEGKNNMAEGAAIYASNHNSSVEGVILNSIKYRPIRFLGKSELFNKPINNFIMKGVGTIPIIRGASDNIAFEHAVNALNNGASIGIFPEGTRGNGKKLQDPHTGVIRLALLSGVPIIPVGISGGTVAWPKHKGPRFFKKVRTRIGEPWQVPEPTDGREFTYEELKELANYLMFELIDPLWEKQMEQPYQVGDQDSISP